MKIIVSLGPLVENRIVKKVLNASWPLTCYLHLTYSNRILRKIL